MTTPQATSPSDELVGPKIALQGDSGAGKTYAFGPLVDWAARQTPPIKVAVLFTENGLETLLGYWRDPPSDPATGKPIRPAREVPANLHWHVIKTPTLGLAALKEGAKKVGLLSYESLTKSVDSERGANNPAYKVLEVLENFPDDRTGQKLGNIGSWGADYILGLDSLTGLADAYTKMVIGNKPVMAQNEYLVAQTNLMNLLRYLTQGTKFGFVMTSHLQKQTNELTGGVNLMMKAIGKAMADDIPQLFSEVIYCARESGSWTWDMAASNVATKTRYLPIKAKINPDLGFIMDKWKARSAS